MGLRAKQPLRRPHGARTCHTHQCPGRACASTSHARARADLACCEKLASSCPTRSPAWRCKLPRLGCSTTSRGASSPAGRGQRRSKVNGRPRVVPWCPGRRGGGGVQAGAREGGGAGGGGRGGRSPKPSPLSSASTTSISMPSLLRAPPAPAAGTTTTSASMPVPLPLLSSCTDSGRGGRGEMGGSVLMRGRGQRSAASSQDEQLQASSCCRRPRLTPWGTGGLK